MSNHVVDLTTQLSPVDELLSAAKIVLDNESRRYSISYEQDQEGLRDLARAVKRVEMIPDQHGWIKWTGGNCPVPFDTLVDISKPSGVRHKEVAGHYVWHKHDDKEDITAFRYHIELNSYSCNKINEII